MVKAIFGQAILETARAVLREFGVTDAYVQIDDKGALDHVIRSRTVSYTHLAAASIEEYDRLPTLIVTMEDGTVYEEKSNEFLGHQSNPMSEQQHLEKFRSLSLIHI